MIELGSKVRDIISGFVGVAVGRTEWLYGCNRIICNGTELSKEGKPIDAIWFDEQRIEVVQKNFMPVQSPHPQSVTVQLGNKVKDKLTGFEGIAVARTSWSSGNVTITVEPQTLREGKPIETECFDLHRVELVSETKPVVSKESTPNAPGGPQNDPKQAM